jgi:diguanylate cyclase (GGDEF)-like protein
MTDGRLSFAGAYAGQGGPLFASDDHLGGAVGKLALARAQGAITIAAGLLGFAGVLLPHPDSYFVPGLVAIQAWSFAGGLLILLLAPRVPLWVLRLNPPASTALTTLAVICSGYAASPYALFYLWTTVFAFYFFSRAEALFNFAFAIVNFSLVILLVGSPDFPGEGPVTHFLVMLAGSVAVAGIALMALRERVGALIDRLTDAARTDGLTGLRSRRGLREALEIELERARNGEYHRPVSLLIADLDHFQEVNNRFGQQVGDRVLRRVGAVLDQMTRRIDTVARSAGEEFSVLLPETGKQDAYMLAERMLAQLRDTLSGERRPLTASIGVAGYPDDGATADELLNSADHALYGAKVLGRDRVVLFSNEVATIIAGKGGERRAVKSQTQLASVLGLAETLDLRDSGTARHSQTVGRLAEVIARELGLPDQRVARIRLAGILHDVGKIGVPDTILQKPGPLSDQEWEEMRRHPEIGERLIGGGELEEIREWLVAHHERPDGGGYPRGLAGDEIPLEARILAVADAFEAMTADRIYRPALGEQAASRELRRGAGTQFDERVVAALLRMLERHGLEPLVANE